MRVFLAHLRHGVGEVRGPPRLLLADHVHDGTGRSDVEQLHHGVVQAAVWREWEVQQA